MSLLVVGSVAFDALESPYGKVDWTLGGAATYFAVSASFFAPVSLVAIVGEDFTAKDEAVFRGRHIDTEGLERAAKAKTMTAIDDLHSYEAITEAHVESVKRLIPAVEALYATMSDAQKKNADAVFSHRVQRATAKKSG